MKCLVFGEEINCFMKEVIKKENFIFLYSKYKNFLIRRILDTYILLNRKKITGKKLEEVLEFCSKKIMSYSNKGSNLLNYEIIDKRSLNERFDDFCSKFHPVKNIAYTAGTTGTPRSIFRSIESIAAEQYYQNKYFNWNSMYKVVLRGEKIYRNKHNSNIIYREIPFIKEMYISSYHINDKALEIIVNKLNKIENKCLWTYPSLAYIFADYCLRKNKKLHFDLVATSSEILFEYQINTIKKAFSCEVKDWYGQAERVAAFYRCQCGNYHEVEGYSHVEYLKKENNLYEIVGTTLHNTIMPLVRYNTNDLVEISEEKCACGNKGRNISCIYGRVGDYIEIDGNKLTATGLYCALFKNAPNIVEAQLYQTREKSVTIRIVKNEKFDEHDEKKVLNTIGLYLPSNHYNIEYVNKIERSGNNKYSYVIRRNSV